MNIEEDCSSLNDIESGNSIKIYPNPANNFIILDIRDLTLDSATIITIINNKG